MLVGAFGSAWQPILCNWLAKVAPDAVPKMANETGWLAILLAGVLDND